MLRQDDLESNNLEAVWVKISTRKKSLLICTIYRPPDSSCKFFDDFSRMMESAGNECKEILVMGDMNINYLSDCSITRQMRSMCDEASLTQMITVPTRVTQTSEMLIDHILTSNPVFFLKLGVWT